MVFPRVSVSGNDRAVLPWPQNVSSALPLARNITGPWGHAQMRLPFLPAPSLFNSLRKSMPHPPSHLRWSPPTPSSPHVPATSLGLPLPGGLPGLQAHPTKAAIYSPLDGKASISLSSGSPQSVLLPPGTGIVLKHKSSPAQSRRNPS